MLEFGLPKFQNNPYIVAILFHSIAEGTLLKNYEQEAGIQEESKSPEAATSNTVNETWHTYFKPMQ